MRKSTIIIVIVILLALLFRLLYTHIDGMKNERLLYVQRLNFKFSARIDSIRVLNRKGLGLIFFHDPIGTFGASEDRLQEQLKFNGHLRFIPPNPNKDILSIITSTAEIYQTGDSLVVDTNDNKIHFYRGNKVISENTVTEALNGGPF